MKTVVCLLAIILLTVVSGCRNATDYYNSALDKGKKGDWDGSLVDYNKAIKLKPDYVDAYIERGGAKYKKDDLEGALADYNKALELKPDLNPIPDLARTPDTTVTNEIAKQALDLLEAKNYDKLDELAAKFRSSKECYADGVWKLNCIYAGLILANRASDEIWGARLTAIEDWTLARPVSITARVALADVLVSYAWKARGAGEVDTVTTEGWRLFGQRLIQAAQVLKEARTLKEQCPRYWSVLMTDALGLQVTKPQFDSIFNEAIKSEPDYESSYYRRAIYLLPRWYGSEGEWENDLAKSADKIGGENGDMLYAQVIWNMQQRYDMNPFLGNNLSWTRVDKGFEVIEKHFPNALAAKIARVQLAVLVHDAPALAYDARGFADYEKNDLDGALADYTKAIELKPNFAEAYYKRGLVKKAKGDFKGVLTDNNKAIELKPDFLSAYFARGQAKSQLGDINGTLADYNKAIELGPDDADNSITYNNRGNLKRDKGDWDGALADYNKAVELKRDYALAYYNRSILKKIKGDVVGAQADHNKAVELNPQLARPVAH